MAGVLAVGQHRVKEGGESQETLKSKNMGSGRRFNEGKRKKRGEKIGLQL